MERLEELYQNLKIYQDDNLYCFTSDAILLSKFAVAKAGDKVADFCSGSGVVGLHYYALNPNLKSLTLFEMQKPLYDLSVKTINYNGLGEKVEAINCKVQDISKEFNEQFSLILCNPPYMTAGAGQTEEKQEIAVCKSELTITLAELISNVKRCLKFGGRFCMVHRADRLVDAISLMRQNGIEPKKLQMVSGGSKEPYLFLIEGVKGGKSGLKILKELSN